MAEEPLFHGEGYNPKLDRERLLCGLERVKLFMSDGKWHTLQEISEATHVPEATVSADLRCLRRERFGGHTVNRRRRGDRKKGLHEYKLIK